MAVGEYTQWRRGVWKLVYGQACVGIGGWEGLLRGTRLWNRYQFLCSSVAAQRWYLGWRLLSRRGSGSEGRASQRCNGGSRACVTHLQAGLAQHTSAAQ